MAHIRLNVEGKPGTITVHAFKSALEHWLAMLKDLDIAISGNAKGSLDWVITELSLGSASLGAEGRNRVPGKNIASDVVDESISGMDRLERGSTPPYLGPAGLKSVEKLVNLIGREGVTGLTLSNTVTSSEITSKSKTNIKELLQEKSTAIGSIEGKMETLNIHRYSRFIVYLSLTKKAVECKFDPETQMEDLKCLLGKRVNVFGRLHINSIGEPIRVEVAKLRRLREEYEIPSIERVSGSVPSLLGDLSSKEHFAEIRGG